MPARNRHREAERGQSVKELRRQQEAAARAARWAAREAFLATPEGIWAEREAVARHQRAEYGPWDD